MRKEVEVEEKPRWQREGLSQKTSKTKCKKITFLSVYFVLDTVAVPSHVIRLTAIEDENYY